MKSTKTIFIVFVVMTIIIGFNSCKEEKKDEPTPTPTTVTDADGNVYHTITIGTQTWMVENLKVTKYNDGTPIPNVTEAMAWFSQITGAWCNYNNNETNDSIYGKLYNWYAVNTGKLAPAGWHIPTDTEWITLKNYVIANFSTSGSVAKALAAKTDWQATTDNDEVTEDAVGNDLTKNNSTGFTALPGGMRDSHGHFDCISKTSYWWSYTQYDTSPTFGRFMDYCIGALGNNENFNKVIGLSVRCVKD